MSVSIYTPNHFIIAHQSTSFNADTYASKNTLNYEMRLSKCVCQVTHLALERLFQHTSVFETYHWEEEM